MAFAAVLLAAPLRKSVSLPAARAYIVMDMQAFSAPAGKTEEPELKTLIADESDFSIPRPAELPEEKEPEPVKEPERVKEPEPVKKAEPVKNAGPGRPAPPPERKPRPKPRKPGPPPAQETEPSPTAGERAAPAVSPAAAGSAAAQDEKAALAVILRELEKHKRYPRAGRRGGAEGVCGLLVQIGADGRVSACSLRQKSGRAVLDAAALQLGAKLEGLYVGAPGRLNVLVPVHYRLTDR